MAAEDSIDWELGKAPKQSITEVLQDPRASALELPDISAIDISTSSLQLAPVTPVTLPPPLDINSFETYLRRYGPLHSAYRRDVHRLPVTSSDVAAIPRAFFDPDFDVSEHVQIPTSDHGTEQPLAENTDLASLRESLAAHKSALERRLTEVLADQSQRVEAALMDMRVLRDELRTTASALRRTRESAAVLAPRVTLPVSSVQDLTFAKENVQALRAAATRLSDAVTAPSDVTDLLAAAAYSAAIDRITVARQTLSSPQLTGVRALFPVRHQLATAVEAVDAALRREFRSALYEADESALEEVVALVYRTGRLSLLHRFFMKEVRNGLADELNEVTTLPAAARVVKNSASRAVLLSRIVTKEAVKHSTTDNIGSPSPVDVNGLREMRNEFEELLASFVDKLLGTFDISNATDFHGKNDFLILTNDASLSEESCFDEFKAALKFGEEIRCLEELATELEKLFSIDKKASPFRAKISEKFIAFVTAFHRIHVDAITSSVRNDKWQEVPASKGAIRLLSAVLPDVGKSDVSESSIQKPSTGANATAKNNDSPFYIQGEAFRTVACGVRFIRSVCAYTLLTEQSATLGLEIARRGTELSRVFNSLVCKAILGVAALQWSGLRSITARHLSLASRTIALAERVSIGVHKTMERALSTSSRAQVVVPLMRQCEKDLFDHHAQLLTKIVDVMLDRLRAHEDALKSLPWEKEQEMARFDIPSAYVATMVKETTILHRILWLVLPQKEAIGVFKKVWVAYGNCLSDAYGSLDGGKDWIRERVAEDVAGIYDAFKKLELSKTSSEAFNPIRQLYRRFAKEYMEEKLENAPSTKAPVSRRIQSNTSETLRDVPEKHAVEATEEKRPLQPEGSTGNSTNDGSIAANSTTVQKGGTFSEPPTDKKGCDEKNEPVHDNETSTETESASHVVEKSAKEANPPVEKTNIDDSTQNAQGIAKSAAMNEPDDSNQPNITTNAETNPTIESVSNN